MPYFTGKTVYVDLHSKYSHLQANIEESLKRAGATTEYFFSKDVDCIITDRKHVNPTTSITEMSSSSSATNPTKTGGASATRMAGTANILVVAQKYRIPVIPLEICGCLKSFCLDRTGLAHTTQLASPSNAGYKIYKLKAPYFKCEDLSRKYRPLVYQWNGSPFQCKPTLNRRHKTTASGYCENCHTRFTDLHSHLAGAKHQSYAQNENNFKGIDERIAAGTSFKDFVAEMRKKHQQIH